VVCPTKARGVLQWFTRPQGQDRAVKNLGLSPRCRVQELVLFSFVFKVAVYVLRLFLWFLLVGNHWANSEIKPTLLSIGGCWGRQGYPSTGLRQRLLGTLRLAFPKEQPPVLLNFWKSFLQLFP